MEFFRQSMNYNECTEDFMNMMFNNFSNFGFVRRNGDDLSWRGYCPAGYDPDDYYGFRWQYDTANKTVLSYYASTVGSQSTYLSNRNTATADTPFTIGANSAHPNSSIIFIPLKNRNFLIQFYHCADSNKITPMLITPNNWTGAFPGGGGNNRDGGSIISFNNLTDFLNPFYYFRCLFDTYDGYVTNVNKTFIIRGVETPDTGSLFNFISTPSHKFYNINSNVCTLTRVPFENTFLDGLFLATTYPMQSIEGKVFSFGGRNFLGVYENLVVELPSN